MLKIGSYFQNSVKGVEELEVPNWKYSIMNVCMHTYRCVWPWVDEGVGVILVVAVWSNEALMAGWNMPLYSYGELLYRK